MITHFLTDTITVASPIGTSAGGDLTFGSQVTMKARVEREVKEVVTADGSTVVAYHRVATEAEIPLSARVWLPGDNTADTNAAKRPLMSKRASTIGGYSFSETYL
jgi:hypothetical protein